MHDISKTFSSIKGHKKKMNRFESTNPREKEREREREREREIVSSALKHSYLNEPN